jgi:hypothetical protein
LRLELLQIATALASEIIESLEMVRILRLHIGKSLLETIDRLVREHRVDHLDQLVVEVDLEGEESAREEMVNDLGAVGEGSLREDLVDEIGLEL